MKEVEFDEFGFRTSETVEFPWRSKLHNFNLLILIIANCFTDFNEIISYLQFIFLMRVLIENFSSRRFRPSPLLSLTLRTRKSCSWLMANFG